ncbi:MAG: FAD/NAD(P)-binding protein [Sandaracinaceae bacterium]|nr:FAD/NAD(P)-binding protein [Sandaracinaceae bacterium]
MTATNADAAWHELLLQIEAAPDKAAALAHALSSLDPSLVESRIAFDDENYARHQLAKTERSELRLICWKPGQSSALHGHGRADCTFRVIHGKATEVRLGSPDLQHREGELVASLDPMIVHQVSNVEPVPLVTLHHYSPPLPINRPSTPRGLQVVVIGGGFSGACVGYHLLGSGRTDIRVIVIDEHSDLGRGVAYGLDDATLRLNVPAKRMSIDPRKPNDFVDWASAKAGAPIAPDSLQPRKLYGDYISDRMRGSVRDNPGKLRIRRGRAVDVNEHFVTLSDGTKVEADVVVLATGNPPTSIPEVFTQEVVNHPAFIADPWKANAVASIGADERVLVVGTGLTGVDILHQLRGANHSGEVVALSRHGNMPSTHSVPGSSTLAHPPLEPADFPTTALGLLRMVRSRAEAHIKRGEPWQLAVEAVRPHISTLWNRLAVKERAKFLTRLRPYWEIHRHRAPIDSIAALEAWEASGTLKRVRAKLVHVAPSPKGFHVTYADGSGKETVTFFDRVILCTGSGINSTPPSDPMYARMDANGLLKQCPNGLGALTAPDGTLLDAKGRSQKWLRAVGVLRRAERWESTAVPELSSQAAATAYDIARMTKESTIAGNMLAPVLD